MGVQVGGLDVVPLLAGIAGLPLLGCHCWVPLLGIGGGGGCTRWRIGRGAIAGLPLLGAIAGCHCLGDRRRVGLHVGMWCRLLGAIAGDRGGGQVSSYRA